MRSGVKYDFQLHMLLVKTSELEKSKHRCLSYDVHQQMINNTRDMLDTGGEFFDAGVDSVSDITVNLTKYEDPLKAKLLESVFKHVDAVYWDARQALRLQNRQLNIDYLRDMEPHKATIHSLSHFIYDDLERGWTNGQS